MPGQSLTFSLQYVFFMDANERLLTCDEAGSHFLSTIDQGEFYAKLQSIQFNKAITNTTIILNKRSYSLRMIPMELRLQQSQAGELQYIIVLQDQTLFSYIFEKLNQEKPPQKDYNKDDILRSQLYRQLDSSSDGIFMTNANGTVIYANKKYVQATGLPLSELLGKNIRELGERGVLNPLLTPTILETKESFSILQKLSTGKLAVATGSPIYDSAGKPFLIISCVNVIDQQKVLGLPKGKSDAAIKTDIGPKREHSIDLIAESRVMKSLLQEVVKVARYDATVLLLGESGVGKEIIASVIHASSTRYAQPYVKINCSAISPTLLESELFGYEPGSFTGALTRGKKGLMEAADGGTLLLDEIGDMPLELQSKLLRVLQEQEFYPVGARTPKRVNVRIISSTNRDLEELIEQGLFRKDLYYRLNVIAFELPPLRRRIADIEPLLLHFCYQYNQKYGTNKQFSDELIDVLKQYHWPGNIRQLQNVVERLIVLCIEDTLLPRHLYGKYRILGERAGEDAVMLKRLIPLKEAVSQLERQLVLAAMAECGSTRKAAEMLKVSQSTIVRRLKEIEGEGASAFD